MAEEIDRRISRLKGCPAYCSSFRTGPVRRREILVALATTFLWSRAQAQKTPPTIGIFGSMGPGAVVSLKEGLREQGLIEGQTFVLAGGPNNDPGPKAIDEALAALMAGPLDLIFVSGGPWVKAAKEATRSIPIVVVDADPVTSGFVESIARPGGNLTGLSLFPPETNGKRLELLTQVVPDIARVAVVYSPDAASSAASLNATEGAADKLKITLARVAVRSQADLAATFDAVKAARAQGLLLLPYPMLDFGGRQIANLALTHQLPVISFSQTFPRAGGLISYGPDVASVYRRAGYYIARILGGMKPGELPIEQPTKLKLIINLGTAKMLNMKLPDTVLARADEVIE